MDVGIVLSDRDGQFCNVGDPISEVGHAGSMGFYTAFRKQSPYGIQSPNADAFHMVDDCYPFRENFQDAVRWLRKSRKIQLADVAKLLGISLDTLHDYLYKRKNRPGRDPLKILSRETGRPMADFDDDPGAPPV
ncbi:MAG: helix-turn-helix transcriptional regulator, partial [Deltaproteobacteria bacterium]|nr:helix-turn-helix transcriptional regulator [Deltaproteobacteria bacterium]